jgi:hypothetical protein
VEIVVEQVQPRHPLVVASGIATRSPKRLRRSLGPAPSQASAADRIILEVGARPARNYRLVLRGPMSEKRRVHRRRLGNVDDGGARIDSCDGSARTAWLVVIGISVTVGHSTSSQRARGDPRLSVYPNPMDAGGQRDASPDAATCEARASATRHCTPGCSSVCGSRIVIVKDPFVLPRLRVQVASVAAANQCCV